MPTALIRTSDNFNEELEKIIYERLKNKYDSIPITKPKLLSMIPKHENWQEIREDLIRFEFKNGK